MGSMCVRFETFSHPLGSPERGAVAPRSGVTEGLRPTWVRGGDVIRRPAQGASRTPPPTAGTKHALRRERQRMQLPHASQKVRGLCPRYYIRWTVEVTVRTVGNVGAIGHAGHPRQRCPGNPATAAHRGRCALRAVAKRPLRHMTQCMRFPRAYQWCAGCARGIAYVGLWARGRRTVENVGRIGHAQRLRLTQPGGHTTAGRRGRRPLRAAAKRTLRHMT